MTEQLLSPIGLEFTGTSIHDAGPTSRLRGLLAAHGVIVFRGQDDVDDDGFLEFLHRFGELTFTVGELPLPGRPELNLISNVGRTTPPRSVFHVDTSYISHPPAYTALRAVEIPAAGGQTVFSNQYRAYETLPVPLRQRLAGRRVHHVVTGVDPGEEQETAAWHPVFRPHPLTGRTSLYLSTPQRCTAISELPDDEARELIEQLYAHSTTEDNTYRHNWRAGDIVMWDNACVLHKADHSGVVGDRVMHRGMVASYGPGAREHRARLRSTGMLALLTAVLPVNAAVTGAALVVGRRARPAVAERPRTVLISGGKMTKALQLCRSFHAAGHRVVLVETERYRFTGHRFSRAVDAFHVVPAPDDDGYAAALLDIVRTEAVDVYVPVCSPLASRYDAQAAELLAGHCEVVHADAATVTMLDDKYEFARRAESYGLAVPDTHRVTDARQVTDFDFDARDAHYILKNLAYDPVNRLDLTPLPSADTAAFARSKDIDETMPWILQELVEGTEYCTHSTVRDGRITVYACCESSPFQINYEMVDKPEIEKWVRSFVEPLGVTGQLSFDFIEDAAGRIVAIECNPRTHSAITMFHDHPDVAAAYLGELDPDAAPLTPKPGSRPTYWLYHEVWRLLTRPDRRARLATILRGKDAIFALDDPLPFLLVHHLQIPSLLWRSLRLGRDWVKIDFNIGKLVEPGGD